MAVEDLDTILQDVMGDQEEPVVETTEPTEPVEESTEPTESTEPEGTEPEESVVEKEPPKKNQAWAQMRVQNKQYEQALANLAKQQGVSVDELLNNIQEDTDKKTAEKQGLSLEVQRQLRQQQEELQALREENQRVRFREGVETLKNQFSLTQEDMYAFIDQAREVGIDLINSPMPMDIIYKALNHDNLLNQAVEKAKQELITRHGEVAKHSPTNTKTPSRSKGRGSAAQTPEQALAELTREGFSF